MNLLTDDRASTVTETDVSCDLITSKNGPDGRKCHKGQYYRVKYLNLKSEGNQQT